MAVLQSVQVFNYLALHHRDQSCIQNGPRPLITQSVDPFDGVECRSFHALAGAVPQHITWPRISWLSTRYNMHVYIEVTETDVVKVWLGEFRC
jgi:hypothetical protein